MKNAIINQLLDLRSKANDNQSVVLQVRLSDYTITVVEIVLFADEHAIFKTTRDTNIVINYNKIDYFEIYLSDKTDRSIKIDEKIENIFLKLNQK